MLKLIPEMAFIDAIDVEVLVLATPVFNLTSLKCLVHDVLINGLYYKDKSGQEYISCKIPSI